MSVDYSMESRTYLKQAQLLCVNCTVCEQPVLVCHSPQLPCVWLSRLCFSAYTPTLRSGSSPSLTRDSGQCISHARNYVRSSRNI